MGGVTTPEAGLDVEDGHVPPAGGVAVAAGHVAAGDTGLVLQEQEEGLHVGPQPSDESRPHHRHCLLIACQQSLEQSAVVPGSIVQITSTHHEYTQYKREGLQLTIIFVVDLFLVKSFNHLVWKM